MLFGGTGGDGQPCGQAQLCRVVRGEVGEARIFSSRPLGAADKPPAPHVLGVGRHAQRASMGSDAIQRVPQGLVSFGLCDLEMRLFVPWGRLGVRGSHKNAKDPLVLLHGARSPLLRWLLLGWSCLVCGAPALTYLA